MGCLWKFVWPMFPGKALQQENWIYHAWVPVQARFNRCDEGFGKLGSAKFWCGDCRSSSLWWRAVRICLKGQHAYMKLNRAGPCVWPPQALRVVRVRVYSLKRIFDSLWTRPSGAAVGPCSLSLRRSCCRSSHPHVLPSKEIIWRCLFINLLLMIPFNFWGLLTRFWCW